MHFAGCKGGDTLDVEFLRADCASHPAWLYSSLLYTLLRTLSFFPFRKPFGLTSEVIS